MSGTPTWFRSSDSGAPTLTGNKGSLIRLLRACLVDGYGTASTGTITEDGTNPADGDTITIGTRVYTFKTALSGGAGFGYEVKIDATAALTLDRLIKAINATGIAGTDYSAQTEKNMEVSAGARSGTSTTISSLLGGAAGDSIAMSTTSAHLSVSANLSGGSASVKTGLGWTMPFSKRGAPAWSGGVNTFTNTAGASTSSGGTYSSQTMNANTDLILFTVWVFGTGTETLTTPAGWTKLVDNLKFGRSTNGESLYVFYKWSTGLESGAAAPTLTASGNVSWNGQLTVMRGVDPMYAPTVATSTPASGTSIATPTATIPDSECRTISILACHTTGQTYNPPTGYTRITSKDYAAGVDTISVATADSPSNASGTTGTITWTSSGAGTTDNSAAVTIVVRPMSYTYHAVFQQGSGMSQFYTVNENATAIYLGNSAETAVDSPAAGTEAHIWGAEACTGIGIDTNRFPTNALVGTGMFFRKSATSDSTARSWKLIGDDRTIHMFSLTGDVASTYHGMTLGEMYDFQSPSVNRNTIQMRGTNTATDHWGAKNNNNSWSAIIGNSAYFQRSYTGGAGAVLFSSRSSGRAFTAAAGTLYGAGTSTGNDPVLGGVVFFPIHYMEAQTVFRGRARGLYENELAFASVADEDSAPGVGAYAGRTFRCVKAVSGNSSNNGHVWIDETGPWETN